MLVGFVYCSSFVVLGWSGIGNCVLLHHAVCVLRCGVVSCNDFVFCVVFLFCWLNPPCLMDAIVVRCLLCVLDVLVSFYGFCCEMCGRVWCWLLVVMFLWCLVVCIVCLVGSGFLFYIYCS